MSDDITDLTNTSGLENVNVQFSPRSHAVDGSPVMDAIVNVTVSLFWLFWYFGYFGYRTYGQFY
jgi:hypothetical protein